MLPYTQAGGQLLYEAVPPRLAGARVAHGGENGNDQMTSLRFEMGGIDVERHRDYVMGLNHTYSKFPRGYFYESAMVGGRDFVLEPLFQKGAADGVLRPEALRYFQAFSLPGRPGCLSFSCPHLPGYGPGRRGRPRLRPPGGARPQRSGRGKAPGRAGLPKITYSRRGTHHLVCPAAFWLQFPGKYSIISLSVYSPVVV